MILAIDIETYSSVDLTKAGVYAYCEAPDFDILLFGYSLNNGPVNVIDMQDNHLNGVAWLRAALLDPDVTKTAFNAAFERICLSRHMGIALPAEQWQCKMVQALTLGLPGNLAQVAEVLAIDEQKLDTGRSLINYFSKPCNPTAKNGRRTRNRPRHDPDKWELFKKYNAQDVRTEMAVREKLESFSSAGDLHQVYILDQKINDTGIRIDQELVTHAIACDVQYKSRLENEAYDLTGLDNPKSVSQLKTWLEDEEGISIDTLNKKAIPGLIDQATGDNTKRVLELRQELSKSSIAKYVAMQNAVCPDGRIRGLFQYYGANRTGRWAGRLVQMQNLPQNHLPQLDQVRELLKSGNYEAIELIFDSPSSVLSQLIRTAFIPSEGHKFIVADFSAIEARVIAWLAGERWRQDVFATHGKIYEASAAQMFKVPIEQVTKGSPLRQKGKIAELALGYGGGPAALKSMGALDMGIPEDELPKLVKMWRNSNPMIVQLWRIMEDSALTAAETGGPVRVQYGIRLCALHNILYLQLPSGRKLAYQKLRIGMNRFGNNSVMYDGMNQTTRKWESTETYGGKIVENVIQAIARDCLAEAMLRLDAAGYRICAHVHDEVILEVPENDTGALESIYKIMGQPIRWAPGLILIAAGFECQYYKKD